MDKKIFQGKMQHYYQSHTDLADPQVSLDWVNDQGWESEIYAFTLNFGPTNQRRSVKRVLRLLTGASHSDASGEYRILTLLNKAGYPVPSVYALECADESFGYPFIVMDCIEGGNFAARFPASPGDDQQPLHDFIVLFRNLHTLDWRQYFANAEQVAPLDDPYFHFDREMALYKSVLSRAGVNELSPVLDWLSDQRKRAFCAASSVVHRDFHPDNILEDEQGRLFVIDWTSAEISDYRFDLAWTLTLALAYRGDAIRDAILDKYERQLGQSVPDLDVFLVAAILRRIGTVMVSLGAGADALGMRPETVNAMRKDRIPLERLYQHLVRLTGLSHPAIRTFVSNL